MPPGEDRVKSSGEFVTGFADLVTGVVNKRQWAAEFTQEQINSYLEEDFFKQSDKERPLPEGFNEPRVVLEEDRIRLAFRYGSGLWSTVISIDLRAWLVATEPNLVVLEFQGLHAGALPISSQWLLERVAEAARQRDIDPTWYRLNGHPVIVLRFQAERSEPTFQFQRLQLQEGKITIAGRSLDMTPQVSLVPASSDPPSQ
jgi:hypothetical protein